MAQPTIARIERGQVDPRLGTLTKLLDACGWELSAAPAGRRARVAGSPPASLAHLSPHERLASAASRSFDPLRILTTLAQHEVVFVVTGELSALAVGRATAADEVEICADWDLANLRRLADVLRILGARAADPTAGVFLADARTLGAADAHDLFTSSGPITISRRAGAQAFDRLTIERIELDTGGTVAVAVALAERG